MHRLKKQNKTQSAAAGTDYPAPPAEIQKYKLIT
jgi:hypothetical protein